jgi:hypothetical protein
VGLSVFMTRAQIRQAILARMGWSTDDQNLSADVVTKVNEFIRQAALVAYDRCKWLQAQREYELVTGIGQIAYNYPATDINGAALATGAGGIVQVTRYDDSSQQYQTLTRAVLRLETRINPTLGGSDLTAKYATPRRYMPSKQLVIDPAPDKAYTLRVLCESNPDISAGSNPDGNVSVVDAESVIIYATALLKDDDGDKQTAANLALNPDEKNTLFGKRISRLRAAENSAPVFQPGRAAQLRRRFRNQLTRIERFGRDRFLDS